MRGKAVVGLDDGFPERKVIEWEIGDGIPFTVENGERAYTYTIQAWKLTRNPLPWESIDATANPVTLESLMRTHDALVSRIGHRPNVLMVQPETRRTLRRMLKIANGFAFAVGKRRVFIRQRNDRWQVRAEGQA